MTFLDADNSPVEITEVYNMVANGGSLPRNIISQALPPSNVYFRVYILFHPSQDSGHIRTVIQWLSNDCLQRSRLDHPCLNLCRLSIYDEMTSLFIHNPQSL